MRRVALDVSVGMIAAIIAMEGDVDGEPYLLVSGGHYHLSDCDCSQKTGYNNIKVREGWRSGYFVLASQHKAICRLVCSVYYTYEHLSMAQKM